MKWIGSYHSTCCWLLQLGHPRRYWRKTKTYQLSPPRLLLALSLLATPAVENQARQESLRDFLFDHWSSRLQSWNSRCFQALCQAIGLCPWILTLIWTFWWRRSRWIQNQDFRRVMPLEKVSVGLGQRLWSLAMAALMTLLLNRRTPYTRLK